MKPIPPGVAEALATRTTRKGRLVGVTRTEEQAIRRQQALEDPGNPGLWGLYCLSLRRQERGRKPQNLKKTEQKPPLLDPLELSDSQLTPEALWGGPAPAWPEDPELGTPEE